MKILYFEGAGSFDYHFKGQDVHFGDVGNCRIRTAFHVKDKAYYAVSVCPAQWLSSRY